MKVKVSQRLAVVGAMALFLIPSAFANTVGSDWQIWNPVTGVSDYVTVETSQTLQPGQFNLGIHTDVGINVYNEDKGGVTDESRRVGVQDHLWSGHFGLGVGLTKWWEVGVTVPVAFARKSRDGQIQFRDQIEGITEVRLNTKLRLFQNDMFGLAAIGRVNFDRFDENEFLGTNPGMNTSAELIVTTSLGMMDVALNGGYRWREKGDNIGTTLWPVSDTWLMSAAVGFKITKTGRAVIEYYRGTPDETTVNNTDRVRYPNEISLAYLFNTKKYSWNVGGATELRHGLSTADWRVFLGMNYAFGGAAPAAVAPKVAAPKPMPMPKPDPTPVVEQPRETLSFNDIKFSSGSANLQGDSKSMKTLNNVTKILKDKGFTSLEIAGHTDSMGKNSFNQSLSQRRAEAVKKKLIQLGGFSAGKINAVGYGESQPIADNSSSTGRAKNRRVEFKIFGK